MSQTTTIQYRATPAAAVKPAIARMLRAAEHCGPFAPEDPALQAAQLALAQPLWNGPRLSALQGRARTLEARFDNAQYDDANRKHWAMADYLGPDAAANPGVRYLLRIRSRYEVANNCYARGIVTTVANDTVGRGPRLHMTTDDPAVNRAVQGGFAQWCREIDLASKLRTMRMAKAQDGETLGVQTNRRVTRRHVERGGCPVALDLRIFEADQCATVSAMQFSVPSVDGIELDEYFQPKNYFILRIHPGNYVYLPGYVGFPWDYDTYPAEKVCHWFRKDRPELHRGIPEITPALNLFAQLRQFTFSVLKSARNQSAWAISIETTAPAGTEPATVQPMDTIEFEDGMAMTMPFGWKANGFNPTNPPATYANFKRELLCEIGRCLNMPLCVIAGDSSGYNYASGRLDFQVYRKSIAVDRSECELCVLDKIFGWWIQEAILIDGYLPQKVRMMGADLSHSWMWDAEEHVDPTKEASAAQTRLQDLTTNLAIEWSKNGVEWESGLEQIARELAKKKQLETEYGVKFPAPPNQASPAADSPEPPATADRGEAPPAEARRRRARIRADNTDQPRGQPENAGEFAPSGTHQSIGELVKDVLDRPARAKGEKHRFHTYAKVDGEQATKLKRATGLDLQGYVHGIEESAINKILKKHGEDEIPFTPADFDRVPEIIRTADDTRLSRTLTRGNKLSAIEYVKRVNGWFCVVQEVRRGRKGLALHTAFKSKTDPRTRTKMGKPKR